MKQHGATDIYCAVTHPVLAGNACSILEKSVVQEIVVTDTMPVPNEKRTAKITVLSMASMLGEAIHRIHSGLSVGAMFDPHD